MDYKFIEISGKVSLMALLQNLVLVGQRKWHLARENHLLASFPLKFLWNSCMNKITGQLESACSQVTQVYVENGH